MKPYPIGIQDFEKLRKEGYLYVDKTRQMYNLINSGSYFFFSRPRRFGKSLLLSTMKYFFQGRRDLFEGLWVDTDIDHDWEPHPVLHFSFSSMGYKSIGVEKALLRLLNDAAEEHGITLKNQDLSGCFRELIHTLGSGTRKVVLLIDEYDKPLTDYLDDLPQAEENRQVLKNFFSIIKDSDPYLRLLLLTGVAKFSKVSLFSDLNNLLDITLAPQHATLTGYTPEEMDHYFGEAYPMLAEANDMSVPEIKDAIRTWYNGYQWKIGSPVYNPFSALNLFYSGRFANFWWESGTPTFLLKLLKKHHQYDLSKLRAGFAVFDTFTLENQDWLALLFQTGYLTLKHQPSRARYYYLDYPNLEVKEVMFQHLLATYRESPVTSSYPLWLDMKDALDAGDMEGFIEQINILFSTIPYQLFDAKKERFFHAVLHLTFQGMGLLTQSEVSTAKGRVDTVVHSETGVYVMEFKLDEPAQAALDQIREKQYGLAYLKEGKPVTAMGISFSSETRMVAEWEALPYRELLTER
ncbi:MAG: AAA family ATPase [Bacteroidota bacterium]